MSTPATVLAVYIGIGLLLMTVAVATRGKEKRTKAFEIHAFSPGDGFDAAVMIFIALLWPIWLVALIAKKTPKE